MNTYGIINVLSLIFLTGIVALVLGLGESDSPKQATRHVLGCWAKLLGGLVGVGLVVYIMSLFAG